MKGNDAFWDLRALVSPSFSHTQILHTLKYSGLKIVDRHAFLVGLPLHGCGHARLRSNPHPLERLRDFLFLLIVFRASSRSPRCSRFVSLALSSLSLFLVLFVLALSLSLSGAPRLQVRRACAPVLGIRKSLICESFR